MSLTYLVLEDEPLIAMDLEFAFEDIGHRAVVAVNNAEASRAISDHQIARAVLDVSLDDLDRVGEHLRELNAPVLPKPQAADDVIGKLVGMSKEA